VQTEVIEGVEGDDVVVVGELAGGSSEA